MERKIIISIVLIVLIVLLFSSSVYVQSIFTSFLEIFEKFAHEHPVLGPVTFTLLAVFSVLLGPFSSIPLTPFAIVAWGIPLTLAYSLLGWFLGGLLSYLIGRYAGKPFVSAIVGGEKLERWVATLRPRLNFSFLLLFRLAMPAETGYVFGIIAYDIRKYLLIVFLAEIPFAVLGVYAGNAFLESGWSTFATLALLAVLLVAVTYKIFSNRLKRPLS